MKKAFITGITGQDGSYLAELLLDKGYEVYGLIRKVAFEDERHRMHRILHIKDKVHLIPGSIDSFPHIYKVIRSIMPDEIYHLAAQSYVDYSFEDEFSTLHTNLSGTHFMLAVFRDLVPNARFYFASSSEMFGKAREVPQNEDTPFHPRSAYGISKVAGFELLRNYRETHGLYACSGIFYNHESPRRGFEYVTRKISSHAAMIKLGIKDKLELGNLDATRDWGDAREYVKAMWLMLNQDTPEDYVICSGQSHTVREFCEKAFNHVGLNYKDYVVLNDQFFRPSEAIILRGDPTKAKKELNWAYSGNFDQLIRDMVDNDLNYFSNKKEN